jgi:nucleoside-diphosphate-sugar epimerase
MRVIVTGAAGMIGSVVTRELRDRGASVHAHAGPAGTDASAVPEGVPVSYADISDFGAVGSLLQGVDAVIHLAGPASVAASFVSPVDYARAHVVGTTAVLEACRAEGVGRLVQVSSAEVYGRPARNPVAEDAPTQPRSPYGAAKLGGEALVRAFCPFAGMAAIVLRPFSTYGPRSPESSLVGRLLRSALTDDVIRLSSLRPVRDYVHVDDVAAAVSAALNHLAESRPVAEVPIYNIGSGVGTSVADLATLVLAAAERQARLEESSPDRPPAADVTELVADTTRATGDLGWAPSVPLADGLAMALEEVRRER